MEFGTEGAADRTKGTARSDDLDAAYVTRFLLLLQRLLTVAVVKKQMGTIFKKVEILQSVWSQGFAQRSPTDRKIRW